jgi:hypothetical protein
MKFTLSINLGNEAMCDKHQVAAALLHVCDTLQSEGVYVTKFDRDPVAIMDINGNRVGAYSFEATK